MRNGWWLGFQLVLRPAEAQPFMHLNEVCNPLPFVLNVNLPKVGFRHWSPSILIIQMLTIPRAPQDWLCLVSFPSILIHFSPTQEYTLEYKVTTNIGNTLLFEKPTIDHDKPLCCGHNGLDPNPNLGQVTSLTWASVSSVR